MKKIMTFKEYSQMMDAALFRYEENNISYYDPTKGWVLTFESKKKIENQPKESV
ncbi:MAG: hypothetical protein IM620_18740 [Cytophagales bacterium]|nr:hypothetical protein [Cytophagales bacterium]